ncbi:PREDICTED: uncharacterized protein LOC104806525 isoform X2 [Tarenaya hassleriana]|uniref:uncharacterized protein LOC104806525 isoform X2 n=1 Tax=Tarenaya hassleriana TaxID=28532 RepID=UPI00053C0F1A|nr:PREDICTED: uncharacterized protein LOC104806525 isoform X2 [Tarenaya hassleriana]
MTEDSGEMHVDGDKISAENNKKRRLKTPAQVMALENFYNEHKYPSEEMKAQLAGEIGLTEKQVSGWFCHRRLKDKRSLKDEGNATVGRQDRSSVVIQDRGSGHRQDSCGSTKQTDYKNFEPREVESQRLYGSKYMGNVDGVDSTSSESSSSLHERVVSGKDVRDDAETSRYVTRNGSATPVDTQVMRNYGYKPSGYLKLKGEIENAAIIAVKRQLGRHYREDGPPLGVEFDPLPPGAFENLPNEIVHVGPSLSTVLLEPIYVGNQRRSNHPHLAGNRKNPSPCPRYEAHDSKMGSPEPFLEDENDDDAMVGVGPSFRGKKSHQQPRLKSPSLNHFTTFPNPNSLKDMGKDSPLETPLYNSKKSWISSKPGPEGMRNDPVPNRHDRYSSNLEISRASPYDYDNHIPETGHKSGHSAKSSNLVPASGKSPDSMERGLSSGRAKVGKYHGERNPVKMYREKLHVTDEPPVPKRTKQSYLQHCYTSKAPYNEIMGCKSQTKGSCLEVPSSFSEDETAETSSSMD